MRRLLGSVLISVLLAGCGGKTERSSGPGSQASSGDGGTTEEEWPSTELGECVPGKPVTSAPSCPWIADGLCYPEKLAACNCVCPKDHDSICMSDFPEPGIPTAVSCF